MSIRRNSSRRRRVVLDEAVQGGGVSLATVSCGTASTENKPSRAYSAAAKRDGQLKTTDLIPKRILTFSCVIGASLLVAALINWLAWQSHHWNEFLSPAALQTLSLSGAGSISRWFSSFLLMLTGMASLQIYAMRRHRCDDYHGAYQVWLWISVLLILASVNFVVDFRAIVESLGKLAGFSGNSSFSILLLAKFVALTGLVVRGIVEIRASRTAVIGVILVWVAYTSAVLVQIPVLKQHFAGHYDVMFGNCILIGTLGTFFSVLTYARFVYLHANELIQARAVAKAKGQAAVGEAKNSQKAVKAASTAAAHNDDADEGESTTTRSATTRTTAARRKSPNTSRRSRPVPVEDAPSDSTESETDDAVEQEILSLAQVENLSKSEKRRLKKLQKRATPRGLTTRAKFLICILRRNGICLRFTLHLQSAIWIR